MSVVELSEIAAELRDVLASIDVLVIEVYGTKAQPMRGAEPRYKRALLEAKNTARMEYPDWRLPDIKDHAELSTFDKYAEMNALKQGLTAARDRARSLRQLLSAMQTGTKVEAEFVRTAPESSFGSRRAS